MSKPSAIVIGAGIVGLATARALGVRGYQVTVFERNEYAVGASIRNFGMIWPIGQPNGQLFERAMLSKSIWKQLCTKAGIWYDEQGSLHLAYHHDELRVMEEFVEANRNIRRCDLLTPAQALQKSPAINPAGLKGALWSPEEMIVEPREAIGQLAAYLKEKFDVQFYFNTAINAVEYPIVRSGKRAWVADEIFVCSGADFETLYPEIFADSGITKCKLQMMRLIAQPQSLRIGPSLCAGLSLTHYKGFQSAASLPQLKQRYAETYPDYIKWGIHVMVSQNGQGELTVGDSHEYGLTHEPFDKSFINQLILDYLKTFATFHDWTLIQSWNGIYAKMTDGRADLVLKPQPGVTLINALSGAGMTMSFGLAEEVLADR